MKRPAPSWHPEQPYNQLPQLPPGSDLESRTVLKACIEARAALAELKQAAELIPNQTMLINTIPLLEAKDSSEIENIVTTTDRLFQYAHAPAGADSADAATKEALRYRTALHRGYQSLKERPLCTATAVEVCRTLKGADMDIQRSPGTQLIKDRTGEVIYTPPEGESHLRDLLGNWERFLHEQTDLGPLVRMAVVTQTRGLLEDALGIIHQLLTTDEPVNFENDRWTMRDARLHLRPYSTPLFDLAVAAVASPTGPKLAGRYGCGLASIGATTAAGFDALALHWDVMQQQAAHYGTTVDRSKWRLVGLVHCAGTMDQAYRDVEYGMEHWFKYFQAVAAFPHMAVPGSNVKEMIQFVNESGFGAIGTPDMVKAQIDRLWVPEQWRLRRVPDARPQLGELRRDPAQLRADRAARVPALPGTAPLDGGRRRARAPRVRRSPAST